MKGLMMTWAVEYRDGTHLEQYSDDIAGAETPYRAINWPEVVSIRFTNQFAETKLDIAQPPPGYKLSLRSRHFTGPEATNIMTFVVLVSRENEPVDASTIEAIYCMPDGTMHQCYLFDCPEIRERCSRLRHGEAAAIHAIHAQKVVQANATVD